LRKWIDSSLHTCYDDKKASTVVKHTPLFLLMGSGGWAAFVFCGEIGEMKGEAKKWAQIQ